MSSIPLSYLELLKLKLGQGFVPHLPELLDTTKSPEQQALKNLSRAFSAFVLHQICGTPAKVAAEAVVDDFDDKGIDAIYYDAPTETLYLIQSKLKESEQFKQQEALAFCQGIRKLIQQDFTGFNQNVQQRQVDIQGAIGTCSHIQLVIAHVGSGISETAKAAIYELLTDSKHGEERFYNEIIDYDAQRVVSDLQDTEAPAPIEEIICIEKHEVIKTPRETRFGLIQLLDLVALYNRYGVRLYEKNIRTFLGKQTDINSAIRKTLADNPASFFYLNNGITALSYEITYKGKNSAKNCTRVQVKGFSIVNGAQTITAAAQFLHENPGANISAARVAITLIEVAVNEDFGKAITQARNHQNQVSIADFAALDDEQERLRRDVALLHIHYIYKGGTDANINDNTIRIDEAAYALALFQSDPRFVVWLKREPSRLLTVQSEQYKSLFSSALTAHQLINAVRFRRYIQQRIADESRDANGQEKLTYQHGEYALGWLLAQRIKQQQSGHQLIDPAKINTVLSEPFDTLRQILWDETQPFIEGNTKGPLALFRNQTDVVQLLEKVSVKAYSLTNQAALSAKRQQQNPDHPYPVDLFTYILNKAPQLANLI